VQHLADVLAQPVQLFRRRQLGPLPFVAQADAEYFLEHAEPVTWFSAVVFPVADSAR
jgi:hypothetical protein